MFPKHSAFEADRLRLEREAMELRMQPEPARLPDPTPTRKEAHGSLEHWAHDLHTVDILLDQDPPDIDRARRLLDDVRREIYNELK